MRTGTTVKTWLRSGWELVLLGVCLLSTAPNAVAQPTTIAFSPDITVVLDGRTIDDEDAAEDDLSGDVTPINVGPLPAGVDLEAYHRSGADVGQLLVLDTAVVLPGGVIATPQKVIAFNGGSYSEVMDLADCGLPARTKIDAMTGAGGALWFSFDTPVSLGETLYDDEDVAAVSGCTWTRILDGSAAGIPSDLDIDGLAYQASGDLLMMSLDGPGMVDGVAFDDEDVLAYNMGSGTWSVVYDGSSLHDGWIAGDLNALDQGVGPDPGPDPDPGPGPVPDPPDLEVAPQRLTFTMQQGASPESKPFTVRATEGTIPYSIQRTASWLDASPLSGESSGEADTIQAIVDPGNLRPGTFTGRLVVNGPGSARASVTVTLIVTGGTGGPSPNPFDNGTVDAADFIPFGQPGHAMAAQSLISISGEDFVPQGEFHAEAVPLPTMLGGVTVTFDGIPAALILVRPDLIIAQLPMGVEPPAATMVITNSVEKAASDPQQVQVAANSPGIFTLSQNGIGQGIVTFAGTMDLAAPVGTVGNSHPATSGDYVTAWVNGLGAVDPVIEDGHNSCEPDGVCDEDAVTTLHETLFVPIVRVGGVRVPDEDVLFSGASVASVGINEVVFRIPEGGPTGDEVEITIEIGGLVSKAGTTIAVD